MFTYSKDSFFAMEPASQAFILLLVSDVLVGYHSADGWQTVLKEVGGHYGVKDQEEAISVFVAIVPVAGPHRYCRPRHPTHLNPLLIYLALGSTAL